MPSLQREHLAGGFGDAIVDLLIDRFTPLPEGNGPRQNTHRNGPPKRGKRAFPTKHTPPSPLERGHPALDEGGTPSHQLPSRNRRQAAPYIPIVNPLIDRFAPHPQVFSLPPPAGDCRGQDALAPKGTPCGRLGRCHRQSADRPLCHPPAGVQPPAPGGRLPRAGCPRSKGNPLRAAWAMPSPTR